MTMKLVVVLIAAILIQSISLHAFTHSFLPIRLQSLSTLHATSRSSLLPNSVADSAQIASASLLQHLEDPGVLLPSRTSIKFDTRSYDETFTISKETGEFCRNFVASLTSTHEMNVRIYFPDEGTAALMRRDWEEFKDDDRVRMTGFSRSGVSTATDDDVCIFYCPLASESDQLEKVLLKLEDTSYEGRLKTLVFMNDELIDMGVTGLGLNGRLLRERLCE